MESKNVNNVPINSDDDLLRLINESLDIPKEGSIKKGVVVKVTPQEVYVDIGSKSEGVASIMEFKDAKIQPGDEVFVYVESLDGPDGRTIVSKHKADFIMAWDKIKDAYQNNQTVEGKVQRQVKGGLMVEVFGVSAFLPGSQIDVKRVRSISSFVGKDIKVKVIKINRARKNIVVSRKEVIEEDREKLREKLFELKEGQIIKCKTTAIQDFGAFCDVEGFEGIDAMIPISELSWIRIKSPEEVIKEGDEIEAKVIDVDQMNLKITLSLKQLMPHPWEKVKEKYPIGSKVNGIVKKIVDYGLFVELEPGVEGLVHISEMKWGKPPAHPSELVNEGDKVELVVLNVEVEKQRISLGMKQAQPDPWSMVDEKYPVGSITKGTVKDFTDYGALVELEEGIEGFLHVGDISWTQRFKSPKEALRLGQKTKVKILNIDKKDRYIELGIKQLYPNPWEDIMKKIPAGTDLQATVKEVSQRGSLVQVDEGLEGYVPASQLHKKGDPRENYKEGDVLNLRVLKVEPHRKRVLLSEKEFYRAQEKVDVEKYKSQPAKINLGEILKTEMEKLKELREDTEEEENQTSEENKE